MEFNAAINKNKKNLYELMWSGYRTLLSVKSKMQRVSIAPFG